MYGPGTVLAGRYRLDEQVGSGGMGTVWRATDQVLSRVVAVKVMRPEMVAQPDFARRFLAEARAMATVKHHAVVGIHDYHSDDSHAFLVMEFVDGEALSTRLRRTGGLDPAATMALVAQAADALQAAHDRGVVHRDVKPANLLVTPDDRLVLTDFGIARSASSTQLTATGAVIGTPSYLAPEQVLGERATPRTDVYALGVVAYECLTGHQPFSGENQYAIATKRLHESPPTMTVDAPAAVVTVVERALATDPERRWASAHALADAARRATDTGSAATVLNADAVPTVASASSTAPTRPMPPTRAEQARQAARPASPPTPPHEPRRPERTGRAQPRSIALASGLLVVTAAALATYVVILVDVTPHVVAVTEDIMSVYYPTAVRFVIATQWVPAIGYGILSLLFLLLAWQDSRGNPVARSWTFVLGLFTLLLALPAGMVAGFVVNMLQPTTAYRTALIEVVPWSHIQATIVAGLIGMSALLVAMVLLMLRPATRYFATHNQR